MAAVPPGCAGRSGPGVKARIGWGYGTPGMPGSYGMQKTPKYLDLIRCRIAQNIRTFWAEGTEIVDHCSPDDYENKEVFCHCDGCDQRYRASELSPIGDGSIKVCLECYSAATAMVRTRRNPTTPEPETGSPRRFSPTDRPAGSTYQNPLRELLRFSGTSGDSGPPAGTMSFAHES